VLTSPDNADTYLPVECLAEPAWRLAASTNNLAGEISIAKAIR
jgi:hypothetical protein